MATKENLLCDYLCSKGPHLLASLLNQDVMTNVRKGGTHTHDSPLLGGDQKGPIRLPRMVGKHRASGSGLFQKRVITKLSFPNLFWNLFFFFRIFSKTRFQKANKT